ncbi:MAG: hypothetical protein ABEI27_03750 [Halobellus sp.]|uniref:hypothetical protein n=1 Tax=Halobellus sp. TaxID=1979212 RepID=UPI0035D4BA2D
MQAVPQTPELTRPPGLTGHLWIQELPTGGWLRFQVTAGGALQFGTQAGTATTAAALPPPYRRAAQHVCSALDREAMRTATDDPESITFVGRVTWNEGIAYPWQEVPAFLGTDVWTDESEQYLSPDMATTAFDRLGLPTLPAFGKEQPAAHTDISQYTDGEEFPQSIWRDGRAVGALIRDKSGNRAQAWRGDVSEAGSAHDDPAAEALAAQYATETRLADTVARLEGAGDTLSVETVRDQVVADIAREHYPALYHDGDPVVSMRAFESAIAETVQRYLAGEI